MISEWQLLEENTAGVALKVWGADNLCKLSLF